MIVKPLIYITMIAILFFDWLVFNLNIGSRIITWVPEICSSILFVYIGFTAAINKKFHMDRKYIIVIIIYLLHIVIGWIVNQVSPGVVFSGLRTYFKFLPFFFLPAVYDFRERELKSYLIFMLIFSFIQCPVALYQRFVSYAGFLSGDVIGGTLGDSGDMSSRLTLYLIFVAAFWVAHYLRGKIRFNWFVIGLTILLIPIGLNETKISFVLIPSIFIIPFIFSSTDRFRFKKMLPLLVLITIAFFGWIASYDSLAKKSGITNFITTPGGVKRYSTGRTELMISAYRFVSKDIMNFVFGVGSGNASDSFSKSMRGKYFKEYDKPHTTQYLGTTKTTIAAFTWEIGVGGIFIICILLGMLFYDAIKYSVSSNYHGIISLSMISVIAIFGVSFFYKQILETNIMVFPFFFLSGFIASSKYYNHEWK